MKKIRNHINLSIWTSNPKFKLPGWHNLKTCIKYYKLYFSKSTHDGRLNEFSCDLVLCLVKKNCFPNSIQEAKVSDKIFSCGRASVIDRMTHRLTFHGEVTIIIDFIQRIITSPIECLDNLISA